MDTQQPLTLQYNDSLTLTIAGPLDDIASFLGLDSEEFDRNNLPMVIESLNDEGRWRRIPPSRAFREQLRELHAIIQANSGARDVEQPSPSPDTWLPGSLEPFFSEVLTEIDGGMSTARGLDSGGMRAAMTEDEVERIIAEIPRVEIRVKGEASCQQRVVLSKKLLGKNKLHLIAVQLTQNVNEVDVKGEAIDDIEVFVGSANGGIVCKGSLQGWPKSTKAGYHTCVLTGQANGWYGIVLHNLRPDRTCKYWLSGLTRCNGII